MTNKEIIEAIGGELRVAIALNVHQTTVQRWANGKIPLWYWRRIIKLSRGSVTPDILFKANNSAVK